MYNKQLGLLEDRRFSALKRIAKYPEDVIGDLVSDISLEVKCYLVIYGHILETRSEDMYEVTLKSEGPNKYSILVEFNPYDLDIQLPEEMYKRLKPVLEQTVREVDSTASVAAESDRKWSIEVDLSPVEEDSIVTTRNVEDCLDQTIRQLNKSFNEDFSVEELYVDPVPNDEGVVSIYVELSGVSFNSVCSLYIDSDNFVSEVELKSELVPDMYRKFVNSLYSKKEK